MDTDLPGLTPGNLLELAQHPNPKVRRQAAGHPQPPTCVLEVLARDPNPKVRLAVAQNPGTPPGVWVFLLEDSHPHVRSTAATSLAPHHPEMLGQSPHPGVR